MNIVPSAISSASGRTEYTVLSKLGSGSCSTVWLGQERHSRYLTLLSLFYFLLSSLYLCVIYLIISFLRPLRFFSMKYTTSHPSLRVAPGTFRFHPRNFLRSFLSFSSNHFYRFERFILNNRRRVALKVAEGADNIGLVLHEEKFARDFKHNNVIKFLAWYVRFQYCP